MAQTIPDPSRASVRAVGYLDCERLDCYRVAVEFQTIAARLLSNRRVGALRDQLDRASVSIVLNIAEGAGRRTTRDKANFFTIARGSATECAAVLDLLLARGLLTPSDHRHGRGVAGARHSDADSSDCAKRVLTAIRVHRRRSPGAVQPYRIGCTVPAGRKYRRYALLGTFCQDGGPGVRSTIGVT